MLYLRGTDNRKLDLVVVLAVSQMDWHLAVKWCQWWKYLLGNRQNYHPFVMVCSPALEKRHLTKLANVEVGNQEIYVAPINEMGYFGSANQMIKAALDHCERLFPERAILWCEADTVPMRAGWVEEIQEEYRWCGRAFMGDVVRCAVNHMTGVAVYHPQWRTLAPSLDALPGPDMTWGWDSQCAHETLAQAYQAKTIQQIWRPKRIDEDFLKNDIRPETALFHQDKSGTLIDLLCFNAGIPNFPSETQICESTYPKGNPHPAGRDWEDLPKMEILIVTFKRDIEFLRYCLRSVAMFTSGFNGVTVVVPETEKNLYGWMPKGARLVTFEEKPGKGMVGHMAIKCHADELCPNADYILHLDADCQFWRQCTPNDFLQSGLPILVRETYAECGKRNPNRLYWQGAVERALGFKPQYEGMTMHPNVHRREIYRRLREMIELNTGKAFDDYVLSGQNIFPQHFAEFPSLGAVAIKEFADKYHFVDYDREADARECGVDLKGGWQAIYRKDRNFLVEWHSHTGIAAYRARCEQVMLGQAPEFVVK